MYMIRIIFGSVFPLLIFTGYSKALEKKIPQERRKGFIKKSNEWLTLKSSKEMVPKYFYECI